MDEFGTQPTREITVSSGLYSPMSRNTGLPPSALTTPSFTSGFGSPGFGYA